MTERDRIIDAFRNCITEPKCKDCPWDECDTLDNRCIEIPANLALAVMRELVAQEPVEPMLKREGWNKYHNNYVCSVCDQELVYEQNYCSECGRAVKWE